MPPCQPLKLDPYRETRLIRVVFPTLLTGSSFRGSECFSLQRLHVMRAFHYIGWHHQDVGTTLHRSPSGDFALVSILADVSPLA